jgi:glycerol-3-phosphate dehydrogenase
VLVDKGDVASGTTSWSTRLIHGGLRYLEHLEVGLVRESLRERERLLRIAPHLVRPPAAPLVGGTKGTHLVVGGFAGAPDEALYVEAGDGRPYFVVPWNDLVLIGTTDEPYAGDLDAVVATDDEIDYLGRTGQRRAWGRVPRSYAAACSAQSRYSSQ